MILLVRLSLLHGQRLRKPSPLEGLTLQLIQICLNLLYNIQSNIHSCGPKQPSHNLLAFAEVTGYFLRNLAWRYALKLKGGLKH